MTEIEKAEMEKRKSLDSYYEKIIFFLAIIIFSLILAFVLLVYYKIIKLNFDKNA